MKNTVGNFLVVGSLFSFLLIVASCAGTTVSETQVDRTYKGEPVSNILVIAVTGNEHNRRLFENTFVKQLKSVGVDAVASEKIMAMPPDLKVKKEAILAAVQQQNNDAVIISQLVSGETKDVETRDGRSFRGFFYFSSSTTYSNTSTTIRLETNLYDVKTQDRIWFVISDSWSRESTDKIISKVIKSVIGSMQKNKLITRN